jgi:hypothetical protein
MFHKRQSNPFRGLGRPSGFQEFETAKTTKVFAPTENKYSCYSFLFEAKCGQKDYVNRNYTIKNRTRDLPVCTAAHQPTAPPRAPKYGSLWRFVIDDSYHNLPVFVVTWRGLSVLLQLGANPQSSSQRPCIQKSNVRSQPSPRVSQQNITLFSVNIKLQLLINRVV